MSTREQNPRRYLVTGGAGFIGSALVRALGERGHAVTVLDDLSTGRRENLQGLDAVAFVEGSITDASACAEASAGADGVFHLAADPSVPRSIEDPVATLQVNVEGTLQVLLAAREAGARRVVIASSCAVYGDATALPLIEEEPPRPRSPYAAQKLSCEHYAGMAGPLFGVEAVCLRFFNVFGPRQDPGSPYAAVIPKFTTALLAAQAPTIFGDGLQSRDFIFVQDAALAAILAMEAPPETSGRVYNVASGQRRTLLELLGAVQEITGTPDTEPVHAPARQGEVRHSHASIARATAELGFRTQVPFEEALRRTVDWNRRQP